MKKYFIIRSDGSSIFEQAYPEEFIFHCLIQLLDRSSERYRLLEIDENLKICSMLPFLFNVDSFEKPLFNISIYNTKD